MPVTCLSQPDFALCDLCRQRIGTAAATPSRRILAVESSPSIYSRPSSSSSAHQTPQLHRTPQAQHTPHQQHASASSSRLQHIINTAAYRSPTPYEQQRQLNSPLSDRARQQSMSTAGSPQRCCRQHQTLDHQCGAQTHPSQRSNPCWSRWWTAARSATCSGHNIM